MAVLIRPYPIRRHLVYVAAFFMDFTFSSGSVAAVYCAKERFGAAPDQLGLFAFLSAGIYVVSTFLFGRLSDRWGRRPNIILACAVNMAVYAAAPWAGTLWQLYTLMMTCSAGQAAFWPAIEADISDHSAPDELPRRLGKFNLAWGLGLCSGSLGGGFVAQHLGHAGGFRMAAGLAIMAALMHVFRRFTPERMRTTSVGDESAPEHAASLAPVLWKIALLVNFASTGLAATVRIHMPTVTGGGHSALGGSYIAMFLFAQFVSFFVMAHWHGWRYRFAPLTVGCLLASIGAAVCGLFAGSSAFGVGCVLAGLGCGVASNLSLYYSVATASSRGHRGGIHEGVLASGAALIPYLGGLLASSSTGIGEDWSKGIPHFTAGAILLLAFLLAARLFAQSPVRQRLIEARTGSGDPKPVADCSSRASSTSGA